MARQRRPHLTAVTPKPGPVTTRHEPSTASRLRATRRTVGAPVVDVPPVEQWPARLRQCSPKAVELAYAMAGGDWLRLEPESRAVVVH